MARPFKICPDCGAHLDASEPCDCKDAIEREPPKPRERLKLLVVCREVDKESGRVSVYPLICIMAKDVANAFVNNAKVKSVLDVRAYDLAVIKPRELPNGLTYIGTIHKLGLDLYQYNEWYLDNWTNPNAPAQKPLVPDGTLALLSTEAEYSIYYGAITMIPEEGKTFVTVEGDRVPQTWVERRPDRRFLQVNSKPLTVPHEVNSWYVAKVLYAYGGNYGVRPLCNLSSGILVSDSPDSDGAYTIIWNRAPSKPSSITVPSSVRGGESLSISWGASTDEDGNLSGYILERQVNGGAWAQVYKGINRSYTDAITFGWTSVAYRVKAYDSAGAESAYNTSATRTVVNNHAPVISGTDSNLGTKTAAFAQSYSVTDEDSGQTLTVTEYIDGTQKRSYTATSGQTYSFNITAAEWVKLLNGSHTLKIVAADNYGGSATRTYTFTKNETEIELMLATPLAADDMVTKGIMSVVRQIPVGAEFTVEVCNNGFDASPTWEDVTQNVVSGSKFFLSNTTKTASAWGYNFRIKVKRGKATGDCFITSAGGNFE